MIEAGQNKMMTGARTKIVYVGHQHAVSAVLNGQPVEFKRGVPREIGPRDAARLLAQPDKFQEVKNDASTRT